MPDLILLEAFPEKFNYSDEIIVSLSVESSYSLREKKINFFISEDFLSLNDIAKYASKYSSFFINWLNTLDEELDIKYQNIDRLKIKPVYLYGYYLQLLIDPFAIAYLKLKKIIEVTRPNKIVLYSYKNKNKEVDYQLYLKNSSVNNIIIPIICNDLNIVFQLIHLTKKKKKNNIDYWIQNIKAHLISCFILLQNINLKISRKEKILFLNYMKQANYLFQYYSKKGYKVIRYYSRREKKIIQNKFKEITIDIKSIELFLNIKLPDLISNRLQYFANNIYPIIIDDVKKKIHFLEKNKIKAVITPYKFFYNDFILMKAAKITSRSKSIQFMHGYTISKSPLWSFTEQPCDIWLSIHKELNEYFKNEIFHDKDITIGNSECIIKYYSEIKQARENIKAASLKPVVLYIPAVTNDENYRIDGRDYPETWYFNHLILLLEYFNTEKDFKFIWKAHNSNKKINGLIIEAIKKEKIDNICFSDGSLREHILTSDLALHDYPSTPFFETAQAGMPTFCCYHESLFVRESAMNYWGNLLDTFSNTHEAIEKFKIFLRNNPQNYIMEFANDH